MDAQAHVMACNDVEQGDGDSDKQVVFLSFLQEGLP
jgi:hypothetical protein